MTTDEATRYLGEVKAFGGSSNPADIELGLAHSYGQATKWAEAADAIARAYRHLGASPPELDGPGYLWHCGSHPIQIAAVQADREMDRV